MFFWNAHIWMFIHFTAMAGLSLYGLHRLWMLTCWYHEKRRSNPDTPAFPPLNHFPFVTVQLPLYNERFVATRLIDASAELDWPKDKMEIQILDDSTDDTREIVNERVDYWSKKGISVKVLRRGNREGFKAGALGYGLLKAMGEFIAIFDADFLPPPEFLLRTVPHFSHYKTGMVQARWGFLNQDHSWLARIQSLLLNPHFSIEHWVRFRRGLFFNFNGTAGIWRKETIASAGGWQSDTVTEDLDLSYRAQLAGWNFVYLDDLVVPSELPVTLASFRSQQQRWAKGSIQTAKKILPRLLVSTVPFRIKIESLAHLLANLGWLLGAIVTLTIYPTILWRIGIGPYQFLRIDLPLFFGTSVAILLYFLFYALKSKSQVFLPSLFMLPVLSIGMAPSLALSVMKGAVSRGGVFERTPKFGVYERGRLPGSASTYRQNNVFYLIMNMAIFAYSLMPVVFAWQRGTWIALPFLMLFPLGFAIVIVKELREIMKRDKKRRTAF